MSVLKNRPTSATVESLATIWQQVLKIPFIGPEDNFFDLGGDSATALEVFNAIGDTFGRELPPVTIYQAPTLATLAALLEQANTTKFPPVVLLKSGDHGPPVLLTHGLGGSVIDFYQVVRHMDTSHPVYGMQARGIDGVDAPFERIEDMAQYYLDAIQEVQPHGPYLLAGFSLGGLVTLEMAQRLSAKGEEVALLALLDAYPHVGQMSGGYRARFTLQRTRRRISQFLKLPVRKALGVMTHPAERSSVNGSDPYQPPVEVPLTPAMRHMRECAFLALRRYRLRPYAGKIRFVKAQTMTRFPANPVAAWAKCTSHIDVDTVPGDHIGIMTTHAADLASVLSRYVKEACRQDKTAADGKNQ